MRYIASLIAFLWLAGCSQHDAPAAGREELDRLASAYVRLGLDIGRYDPDFVDAYYGPDSLKPTGPKDSALPAERFLQEITRLQAGLKPYLNLKEGDTLGRRALWMAAQLTAFARRVRTVAGEQAPFDTQASELFGVTPPRHTEAHFRGLLARLDSLLPGSGPVADRYAALAARFIIPKEKVDTVIKATIAESKHRTLRHFTLPAGEDFRMEYVTGKPWSGYNWYGGSYKSLIQFNTDITSYIDRIIDVASHEGYPGHHVYNSLLEKNLYREKGWIEISLYPLFSPQSLIAEGSANYGVELAFPREEKLQFIRERLFPLAGLDTAGLAAYFTAVEIKGALAHVRTEIARGVLDGTMNDAEALRWFTEYGLYNRPDAERALSFTRKYGSYVINYTYGMDLVRGYIETGDRTPEKRWAAFGWLLSNPVRPADLNPGKR